MKQEYLEKLEYNKILEKLSTYCKTEDGKKYALKLLPANKANKVKHKLLQTAQAVNMTKQFQNAPISNLENVSIYIKRLKSSGILRIEGILILTNVLKQAEDLQKYFYQDGVKAENYSELEIFFSKLYTNTSIIEKISKCIIDKNTIADTASKKLYSIRKQKQKLEQDIKDKLNKLIHSSYSKYMQDPIVTIRNERYVVPVKGEYRGMIKGFVHDVSSSGSTVFIEPITVFDANTEINNLKIEENIEIEKILKELSSLFIPFTNEIEIDFETIGILDFIFAKAYYSNDINGITPTINNDKKIKLINARHPLIDPKLVVPISVTLGETYTTLVITGPNTGGKTVALKTIGLLSCMANSGLNIPADEQSSIFVFDNVYADIGDNQSIANSLSTFSSHMVNIIDIIKNVTSNSLVLIDELGSGTDPIEGANLAVSILEYLNNIGCLIVSTTHYQELKKYALVTKKFENASVDFDVEHLKPTYKLLIGIPGKSYAFEISEKLGLPQQIINKASSMINSQDVDFEELLKNIYNSKIEIENEKEEIDKNLNQVTQLRKQLEKDNSAVKEQETQIISDAKKEARDILLKAKDESTEIISQIRKIANNSEDITKLNNLRNKLNDSIKLQAIVGTDSYQKSNNAIKPEEVKINLPVYVTTLNKDGIIVSNLSKSNEVQVQIGSMKTSVNINYLEKRKNNNKKQKAGTHTKIYKSQKVSPEINVIGLTVDEAIPVVDKFLDDCYLAKLHEVRIVHGKGTGKLRKAIQAFLKKNPHVKTFRIGTFGEGEMGVTIVELKK